MSRPLRLGTRGSDLARAQSALVATMLRDRLGLASEEVIIKTTGDREQNAPGGNPIWSPGAFVAEIERALLADEIDLAVHSFKDMATAETPGLSVAATPPRGPAHDVLVFATTELCDEARRALAEGPRAADLTIGTSSPRRTAQLQRALGCRTRPIRGNVPTRLEKLGAGGPGERVDGVCLAAAGLQRLELAPPHTIELPLEDFPTAAGQGALAVQARGGAPLAQALAGVSHHPTMTAATAERAFLRRIDAGCHTAAAATATREDDALHLHVEYFTGDGVRFESRLTGADPEALGMAAGDEVLAWLDRC